LTGNEGRCRKRNHPFLLESPENLFATITGIIINITKHLLSAIIKMLFHLIFTIDLWYSFLFNETSEDHRGSMISHNIITQPENKWKSWDLNPGFLIAILHLIFSVANWRNTF
jgi:hypothetical protein